MISIKSSLILLLTSTLTSAASPPSLSSIRDSLSNLENSILHSLLSLSSISKSTSLPTIHDLEPIFHLTFNQTFHFQVPSTDFISETHPEFPPYLLYDRGNGSKFGDDSTHNRTQSINDLFSFFKNELFINSTSSVNSSDSFLPNSQNLILLESATFLSLLSSRIHLGISVAEAKFSSNQTDLCGLIEKDDRVGIRQFITVQSQETLVKDRVQSKARAWSTLPIITSDFSMKPKLNDTVQPEFDGEKARKLFER